MHAPGRLLIIKIGRMLLVLPWRFGGGAHKRRNVVESYTYNYMLHVCHHLVEATEELEHRLCRIVSE